MLPVEEHVVVFLQEIFLTTACKREINALQVPAYILVVLNILAKYYSCMCSCLKLSCM